MRGCVYSYSVEPSVLVLERILLFREFRVYINYQKSLHCLIPSSPMLKDLPSFQQKGRPGCCGSSAKQKSKALSFGSFSGLEGSGFWVWLSGFREFRVQGLGFRVQGLGFLGFRVQAFWVSGSVALVRGHQMSLNTTGSRGGGARNSC